MIVERLKRAFGFSRGEDPLRREIEEIRKAAKAAIKSAERVEKLAIRGSGRGGRGALDRAGKRESWELTVEELESIFSELDSW